MPKSKAQSNKEFKQKVKDSGGKMLTLALNKEELTKLESFMLLHNLKTYKEFLNFSLDYKLVQFNDVYQVPLEGSSVNETFIKNGKRYAILPTIVYAKMCRDIETGEVFPFD